MAKAEINSGICGFVAHVEAKADPDDPRCIYLTIESECKAVQRMAAQLTQVDPYKEFSFRGSPQILEVAPQCLSHAACPVPSGIIKAVEIEANLALPADVTIKLSKD